MSTKMAEALEHASPSNAIAKSPAKPSLKAKSPKSPKAGKAPAAVAPPPAKEDENSNQLKFALMEMTLSEVQSFLYGRHVVSPDDVKFRVDAVTQGSDVTLKSKPGLAYWDFKLTCIHPDASTWAPEERMRIYSGPKMRKYVLLFSEPM